MFIYDYRGKQGQSAPSVHGEAFRPMEGGALGVPRDEVNQSDPP